MTEPIPPAVLELVKHVPQLGPLPPHPLAWHLSPAGWVIVLDDGRKLHFPKEAPAAPTPTKKRSKP